MKVLVSQLQANPYRDMKHYPIDRAKVETLKESIRTTGFWDNILARYVNGQVQIAYGHHRLVALQEAIPHATVDIPVKELSDALMLKIMARENSEEWRTAPVVIDETVAVAKRFLEAHPEEIKKVSPTGPTAGKAGKYVIGQFLGWPPTRVGDALERLGMYERGELDRESVKKLPTDAMARTFVGTVKKFKSTLPQQKKMVDKIVEERGRPRKPGEKPTLQEHIMESAAVETVFPSKQTEAKQKQFEDHLADIVKKVRPLIGDLEWVLENEKAFTSKFIEDSYERLQFATSVVSLALVIQRFKYIKPGMKELTA
jgi:hypothetical protein